jgi:hypothetical protein
MQNSEDIILQYDYEEEKREDYENDEECSVGLNHRKEKGKRQSIDLDFIKHFQTLIKHQQSLQDECKFPPFLSL